MLFRSLLGAVCIACSQSPPQSAAGGLGGTSWQLVRFQGDDDKVLIPDDKAKYTIAFGADGSVVVRSDCDRGRGTWKSSPRGQLEFGPLALTRAACPPGSLHDRIVKHWAFVRSYLVKDGHLFLSLMADGGIYELEPTASAPAKAAAGPAVDLQSWLEPTEPLHVVGPINYVGTPSLDRVGEGDLRGARRQG